MDPFSIIDKYYKPNTDLYNILVSHSRDVADKSLWIAQRHPELSINVSFLEEASMLHDIGIYLTKAPKIYCYGAYPYICHGYLGSELLAREGYPKHALVAERHTGTGISLERIIQKNLPLPLREMIPVSMEEQIICFADLFFSKSQIGREKSLDKIRKSISRYNKNDINIFNYWCDLFL